MDVISRQEKYATPLDRDLGCLTDVLGQHTLPPGSIDHIFEEIISKIKIAEKAIPRSKYRPNSKPFWNLELTNLKKDKVEAFRRWGVGGRPRDPHNPLFIAHKNCKKKFIYRLRALSKYLFWKLVRKSSKNPCPSSIAIKKIPRVLLSTKLMTYLKSGVIILPT